MTKNILITSLHGNRIGLSNEDALIIPENTDGIEFKNIVKGATVIKTISSAQVLALNTTPIEVVPAPGAGYIAVPRKFIVRHAGGTAYAGIAAGEDLTLKYTDASGAQCAGAIETTGFLDQTTAQIRIAGEIGAAAGTPANITPVANAAIVLHLLSGNITTGDFALQVFVEYDIISSSFAG